MSLPYSQRRRGLGLATGVVVLVARLAYAQALGTFSGQVVDQGDAVLPGVTVTATHTSTRGLARPSPTRTESIAFRRLPPGPYEVKAELSGFAPGTRRGSLIVGAALTLDFTLGVAALSETLTVSGAAPLIEVTQSRVGAVMQATEVANTPVLTRNYVGLVALLRGQSPSLPASGIKTIRRWAGCPLGDRGGAISHQPSTAGTTGTCLAAESSMNFSQESMKLRLSTHQFTAVDGRTNGAALRLVTKWGGSVSWLGPWPDAQQGTDCEKLLAKRDNIAEAGVPTDGIMAGRLGAPSNRTGSSSSERRKA